MDVYQGVILGVLQGLTEFLPVSSSGHLALGQAFFRVTEPALFFDVSLHMGTLLAVVVVFFSDVRGMIQSLFKAGGALLSPREIRHRFKTDEQIRMALLIIVGSIPTVILGLLFKPYVHSLFGSINMVGVMLLVTGTFLWMTRKIRPVKGSIMDVGMGQALLVGLCQGMAVLPGISRSGATISAGLFSGMDRETAARFSFLLSLPAIVGAEILALKDVLDTGFTLNLSAVFYGTIAAFGVGYLALILLLRMVRNGRLHLFSPYCWVLGAAAVVLGAAG